jgi:hypothetical protein
VYRTANVLNKAPKPVQLALKAGLREIHGVLTRAAAEAAVDIFAEKYGAKCAKAAEWLTKDRDALLAFYDSPAEHWDHLRTSSPIESVFATVRHRTVRTKGSLSPTTARPTVFTLVMAASKTWRRLKVRTSCRRLSQVSPSGMGPSSSSAYQPAPPDYRITQIQHIAPIPAAACRATRLVPISLASDSGVPKGFQVFS